MTDLNTPALVEVTPEELQQVDGGHLFGRHHGIGFFSRRLARLALFRRYPFFGGYSPFNAFIRWGGFGGTAFGYGTGFGSGTSFNPF